MTGPIVSFYVTGGTLSKDALSYVQRRADKDLYDAIRRGEFCYVLTSRQMGKSSLMVRVASRLRQEGLAVAVLDLTALGRNVSPEQWYDGLLARLGKELDLEDELDIFWQKNQRLGPLQRWMEAIRQVVLPNYQGPVVIFVDEIDIVRSLPFTTDEFFAGIREFYNRRPQDPELHRLTFCLLGVATPADLIRETRITPFNIGQRIELEDFTAAEAAFLAQGLGREPQVAKALLDRILYWTAGHPYLTQRLCHAVAEDSTIHSPAGIDRLCETLFLSTRARERDNNLIFVRERLLRSETDSAALLDLYRQVRARKKIRDDDTNPLITRLRLSGIIRVVEGYLWVRNRIYFRVFDQEWIWANLPGAEKQRQRRAYYRGLRRASAVATLIIVFIACGIYGWYDAKILEHTSYYNVYMKRFGVPVGIGRLTPEQVQKRNVSFAFLTKGRYGPVLEVTAIDARGEPTSSHGVSTYFAVDSGQSLPYQECRWEFVRDNAGRVVYEKAYDKFGNMVWGFIYSPDTSKKKAQGHYVGPDGYPRALLKSAAEFVEIQYSPQGDEILVHYLDRNRRPQAGPDRAFGRRQRFDERGLTLDITSLDRRGKPMNDTAGNATLRLEYNELGNTMRAIALDASGHIITTKDGWAHHLYKYDESGNMTEETFLDILGKPTLNKERYHRSTIRSNGNGQPIEWAYFDVKGRPTLHRDGYHKINASYDIKGNRIAWAYFDTRGRPVLDLADGVHRILAKYDARGNPVRYEHLDTKHHPILAAEGYFRVDMKYDGRGREIEWAYFDTTGHPTLHRNGYHRSIARYDDRGNLTQQAYFDDQGRPTLHNDGYHSAAMTYDSLDNQIEWTYFDLRGNPTYCKDGYHRSTAVYDEAGNRIRLAYFDVDGTAIRQKQGYHGYGTRYDERGNVIESAYFDLDGSPVLQNDGYHKIIYKYDGRDNQIEAAYFDTADVPVVDKADGTHKMTVKFDSLDRQIEWVYSDTEGRPTQHKDGYHKATAKHDERGNQVEWAYFDTKGAPTLDSTDRTHKLLAEYDERGNRTDSRYFGVDGRPTRHMEGYHRLALEFDARGNVTQRSYFDETNKPVLTSGGYHILKSRYDAWDHKVEVAYFGLQVEAVLTFDNYHKMTINYDSRSYPIEEAYFDTIGKPIISQERCHRIKSEFDNWGHPIMRACFDLKGKPTLDDRGHHKYTAKYNRDGEIVSYAIYGVNGEIHSARSFS